MSTDSFAKSKEVLEKFFQDRIIFKDNTVSEGACCFYSINTYNYSMNIIPYIICNIKGILKYLDSLGRCKGEYFSIVQIGGKESESCEYFKILHMEESEVVCHDHELFGVEPFNVVFYGLYKKFSKKIKSDECVICLSNPPNVLFCICGHLCVCNKCGDILETERGRAKCPLCREINRIKIRVI